MQRLVLVLGVVAALLLGVEVTGVVVLAEQVAGLEHVQFLWGAVGDCVQQGGVLLRARLVLVEVHQTVLLGDGAHLDYLLLQVGVVLAKHGLVALEQSLQGGELQLVLVVDEGVLPLEKRVNLRHDPFLDQLLVKLVLAGGFYAP